MEPDRIAWVQAFEQCRDAAAVCARFGIARATLRKWWRRYETNGLAGLEGASRAPIRSPARKIFEAEAARIAALRAAGLSLVRIRATLLADGTEVSVPTIRRALARQADKAPPLRARHAAETTGLFGVILPDDVIFRAIAGQIASGQLQPGARLSEDRLCQSFRAGRSRVREALRVLGMVGLVSLERNRGIVIATPSDQAVADAYAARRLIEAGIVRMLAQQNDPAHIAALRHHLRRQSDAERGGDKVTLVRLLTEFHLLLATLAGNPFLRGFVETLATTTSLAVLIYDQSATPSCAVAEHRQLVRLIEQGNGEAAAALMTAHLGHNQQRLRLDIR